MGYYVEKPTCFNNQDVKKHAKIKVKTKANFITSFGEENFEEYEVYLWKGMCHEFINSIPLNSAIAIKGRLEIMDAKMILVAEMIEKLEPSLQ